MSSVFAVDCENVISFSHTKSPERSDYMLLLDVIIFLECYSFENSKFYKRTETVLVTLAGKSPPIQDPL